jgi:hypothetical protein
MMARARGCLWALVMLMFAIVRGLVPGLKRQRGTPR